MAMTPLTEEERRLMKEMLQGPAWKLAVARLEELSIRKEREKADALRAHSFDLANRLQGIVDGIAQSWDSIERTALKDKADSEEGFYN